MDTTQTTEPTTMTTLRFFWNGIKDGKGASIQRARYSMGGLINFPADTLTIYARDCAGFSAAVQSAFAVQNDSDGREDYFENDRIRVASSHPLYAVVLAAYHAQESRRGRVAA
jgi:hypothetical protein